MARGAGLLGSQNRMWSRRLLASAVTRTYGTWICG
ncbi:hypothetical protein PPTG_24541 [Phytophthora nicotianae INRA-310]|uniref:Uncharacterized protein n=2 Tax=Phytophthora nicotianae TaxID=4792 RepID=W2PCS2_PHYN3|nr:hypothetical protein PPTG_24541 [Phytophthora nicotianae INRA-310]ETM98837.1 hypothetical protein PPTG_24541 [Phytophthora nicotianae INRA-310]ETO83887.1 hypothetical protein F444_02155 [Phytophthora nicotianae P1976]